MSSETSPFHAGELALQRRLGVAERIGAFGSKVVRNFMPDQHRDFFAQLPFILTGSVDKAGDVWASLATGPAGFAHSPTPTTLSIRAARDGDDPADEGLDDGASVGLLGIELHTRRRNRMNGTLHRADDGGFTVDVEHSFGNCPKYIQLRDYEIVPSSGARPPVDWLASLDEQARETIRAADTFFVASYVDREDGHRQVDVSHRGGKPGFIRIDANDRLVIPDFVGNHYFNTLGNILANGKAGLLFVDFSTGSLLQMSGDAQIDLDSDSTAAFSGSEHIWSFTPRRIVRRAAATHLRWRLREDGLSPFNLTTGAWGQVS